jgi:hypothetical protein
MKARTVWITAAGLAAALWASTALAAGDPVPNSFTAGTTAKASEVNANFQALADRTLHNTVGVNAVDGDAAASGTALVAALAAISDATQAKPYLVRLSPGQFDVGSAGLAMKPFVSIEGSGTSEIDLFSSGVAAAGGTRITGTGAVVTGATHAALRRVSIESTNSTGSQSAISYTDVLPAFGSLGPGAVLEDVTILVKTTSGGTGIALDHSNPLLRRVRLRVDAGQAATGIILSNGSAAVIKDVEIKVIQANAGVQAKGVYNTASNTASVVMRRVDIDVTNSSGESRGLVSEGGTMTVLYSNIISQADSIVLVSPAVLYLGWSNIYGADNSNPAGAMICAYATNSYDFAPAASGDTTVCPRTNF